MAAQDQGTASGPRVNTEHLVAMVNDIAAFFATGAEAAAAEQSIANHLVKYWAPRMRSQIKQHLAQGGTGLTSLSRAAVTLIPD